MPSRSRPRPSNWRRRAAPRRRSSEALIPWAYAKSQQGLKGARQDAARAWEIASRLRRFVTFMHAVYATANVRGGSWRETAGIYRRAAEELAALGAPHSYVAEMCAQEATHLLAAGDWLNCRRRLRVALGARPGPRGDAVARLTAAELACRQGRQAEAEGHLARAEEIFAVHEHGLSFLDFDYVRGVVALGAGDPERAFDIAVRDLDRGRYVEDMLPIAARALADLAEACRDDGRDLTPVLARLADFRRRYPFVIEDLGVPLPDGERRALQARADAETARATRDPAELALWRAAADACREAEMPWEEAYARWRQAHAALRDRRTHHEAPEALRSAHRLAADLAAQPLLADLEKLARSARIDPHPNRQLDRAAARPARADQPRTGGARLPARRRHQRRDREGARAEREDDRRTHLEHAPQDRDGQPGATRRAGPQAAGTEI